MVKLLKKIEFNPYYDILVFLGDYINKGQNSKKVLKLLKKLNAFETVILLLGNHEKKIIEFVEGVDEFGESLYFNGGIELSQSYGVEVDKCRDIKKLIADKDFIKDYKFIRKMKSIYLKDKYIFVHAGLNPEKSLKNQKLIDKVKVPARIYLNYTFFDKNERKIISGHNPVRKVKKLQEKILVDTGCGKGGFLSCIDLTNDIVYST